MMQLFCDILFIYVFSFSCTEIDNLDSFGNFIVIMPA